MDFRNFVGELRRRNVYRVAAAYAVAAWLVIQVATQVFPFLGVPNWGVQLVVLAALIGFPIALAVSWAFEITPEGIVREENVDRRRSIVRRTGRKITALTIVLAAIAAGLLGFRLLYSQQGVAKTKTKAVVAAQISSKSIAVLPFENLSEEKANAYFAEGIQDEILTRLSKIADLKVISRTSTQHYQSAPDNLPEIARQLGVAHVLEGSVQKQRDQVRVNVQLIRAADDSHLWAQIFDRQLTDIFSVESEVAKAITDQLRVHLTGQEKEEMAAKATEDPDAYDSYLRGLAYTLKTQNTPANYLGAQKYLRDAVKLDGNFAPAWALLSYVDSRGYRTTNLQQTPALREEARQAAETALNLQPDLGEGWLAKGYYNYGCVANFDEAIRCYERARQLLPNSSRVTESLAFVARNRGQWDKTESYFDEAEKLDPRNVSLLHQHGQFYLILRRFADARKKFDQVLEIVPGDVDALVEKAAIAQAEGDLPGAAALLAPLQPATTDPTAWETLVYQAILQRRCDEIIPRLRAVLSKADPALGYLNGELRFWLGWAQEVAGDHSGAQETWRETRSELETLVKTEPENWSLFGDLALIAMGLGDKASAFRFAENAIAANPVETDAANSPQSIDILARVAARLGETDRAIATLERILSQPGNGGMATGMPLTPALLRLDPTFDSLRSDPRFEKLTH